MSLGSDRMTTQMAEYLDVLEAVRAPEPNTRILGSLRLVRMMIDPSNVALLAPLGALLDYLITELAQARGQTQAQVIADLRRETARHMDGADELLARFRGEQP